MHLTAAMPVSAASPPLDHALEGLQAVEAVGVEAVWVCVEVAERQGLVDQARRYRAPGPACAP